MTSCLPYRHVWMPLIAALALATMLTGCGTTHQDGDGGSSSPSPTVTISANPTSIMTGQSATLLVTAANAGQVVVTGADGSSYTLPSNGGSQVVSPAATTTYTAMASENGRSATATATVSVAGSGKPTVNISASLTSINVGGSSTLTVTAANATQVTITGSDNSSYNLQPNGGTQSVTPGATTTYTATAVGEAGTATAQVTITVTAPTNPPPVITIAANPTAITAGSSSILTVKATDATQVTMTGSDKSNYTLSPTGGTQAVSPAETTTYTTVASGPGGTTTATVTITVTPNPPPTVTITANPASIIAGGSSTLMVKAANATAVKITGDDGSSYTLSSTSGTQSVSPAKTTTYVATGTGPGGSATASTTVTVTPNPVPTVTIEANPTAVIAGNTSNLTITATNATQVTVAGSDNSSYNLQPNGGTLPVKPASTTTYTATATGAGGSVSASTTITVNPPGTVQSIDHVIFMLQENHTFDNYFGMLNPYRKINHYNVGDDGKEYDVDGVDDKLGKISNVNDEGTAYSLFKFKSTCVDDMSSDWLASFGDVNRYDFLADRAILMDGFVHNAEGFAKSCANSTTGSCSGNFTDTQGQRSMGYYDESYLNYYYYMASQFTLSDRWFSPVASKSISNRIATFTGGTTQGLVKDPGGDDHLGQLDINNIFQELDDANVSWKIYYTVTQGFCLEEDDCTGGPNAAYPATDFSNLSYSYQYLYANTDGGACKAPTQQSSVVGDSSNSFCIDTNHIAPLSTFYSDLANGTLPSFAFIEAGYGNNDEHPGSGQSILMGQAQVGDIVGAFMKSASWKDSVFFLSYDEGGGPYEHVPPVRGHSNDNTSTTLGAIPDISQIAVNPDNYNPCVPDGSEEKATHCDLSSTDPGANAGDAAAAAEKGFAAQLGFRVPNIVISPFSRRHYVSHIPMDHTAVIKFVENRFIGSSAHLTARDAAQPDLLDFFDFDSTPWSTPPSPPMPVTAESLGMDPCTPANMGP